jgi:hypothetical protein
VSNTTVASNGRQWTTTDRRSQVRDAAALAVDTATWLRDEEAGRAGRQRRRVTAIVSAMANEREAISEAALEAVANLLAAGKAYGIGITFEPDGQGWSIGYMRGMGGGDLASAYDLEAAAKAAERPLDELAQRLATPAD